MLFPTNPVLRELIGGSKVKRGEQPGAGARASPASDSAAVQLEGVYKRPLFTGDTRPYPITGRGQMTVSTEGVEIRAAEVPQTWPALGFLILVAVIVCDFLGVFDLGLFVWLLLALTIALAVKGSARWIPLKTTKGKQWSIVIPWAHVDHFDEGRNEQVLIRVIGMKKSGDIRFTPDDGAEPLLDALHDLSL